MKHSCYLNTSIKIVGVSIWNISVTLVKFQATVGVENDPSCALHGCPQFHHMAHLPPPVPQPQLPPHVTCSTDCPWHSLMVNIFFLTL